MGLLSRLDRILGPRIAWCFRFEACDSPASHLTFHRMSTSAPEQNAYGILNVAQDVSEADLRKAYRTQSLKVHPDRVSGSIRFASLTFADVVYNI